MYKQISKFNIFKIRAYCSTKGRLIILIVFFISLNIWLICCNVTQYTFFWLVSEQLSHLYGFNFLLFHDSNVPLRRNLVLCVFLYVFWYWCFNKLLRTYVVKFLFSFLYLLFMCYECFACMCSLSMCMPGACGSQKAWNSMALELPIYHVDAEN